MKINEVREGNQNKNYEKINEHIARFMASMKVKIQGVNECC